MNTATMTRNSHEGLALPLVPPQKAEEYETWLRGRPRSFLEKSIAQANAGLTVTKTLEELEAMEG